MIDCEHTSLQELNLGYCNLSEGTLVKLFYGLTKNDNLLKLNVSHQKFENQALVALGAFLNGFYFFKNKEKKDFYLDLSWNQIGPEGMNVLNYCVWNLVYIGSLNLSGNNIRSEGIQYLKSLLKHFRDLKCLDLSTNKLEQVKSLTEVNCFQKLQDLNLSNNNLQEFDPENVPNLRILNLSKNRIKFMGALKLANYLKFNPIMRKLVLDHNELKSEGFNLIIFALR